MCKYLINYNKIFKKTDFPFDFFSGTVYITSKACITDKHDGEKNGSIIQKTLETFD